MVSEAELIGANSEYVCTTGEQFRSKVGTVLASEIDSVTGEKVTTVQNKEEFFKFYKNLKVLASSEQSDKNILIAGVQQCHGVIAFTGSDTADAESLKKADIGISMGTGTDIV